MNRRAPGFDAQRQSSFEYHREFPWPRQQRHVRPILLLQWNALAVLMRVEHGHPAGQRNLADAFAKDLSLHLHRATHSIVFHVQLHFSMLDGIRERRRFQLLRRPAREFDQLVVLIERKCHVARIRQWQRSFFFCRAHTAKQQHHQESAFHRTPPFFSRWKLNSAAGLWFSLVSSETRNMDGPNAGNATLTGRMPVTLPALDLARNVSRSAFVASFFSSSGDFSLAKFSRRSNSAGEP